MTRIHPKAKSFLTPNGKLEKIIRTHFISPPEQLKHRENSIGLQLTMLNIEALQYKLTSFYEQQGLNLNHLELYRTMYENTTNLVWHGGNLEPHYSTIEIFASPNGILTKCNDNGGYFKRQAVKRAWERKEFFPEKHTGELNGPEYKTTENIIDPGIGTGIFYNWSDFIYVDTDTGTLYLGIDTQNEIFFPKEPKNNTKLSRAEFKLDRKELEEQRHPS